MTDEGAVPVGGVGVSTESRCTDGDPAVTPNQAIDWSAERRSSGIGVDPFASLSI